MNEDNFVVARETLNIYEKIFGAQLNMDKTTLVLMDDLPPLDWLATTRCKVAQPGEVIRYLGSPIGVYMTPTMELEYLLGKVRKRLSHWSNRIWTLQGRIVLMKHVLRAIPVFHLIALDMNQDGFKLLEGMCREFVWGLGEQGNPRVPLIAWDIVVQPAALGGLSITSFQKHALLLKLRCAA